MVWSTFATDPSQGGRLGRRPEQGLGPPGYQVAPGIGPALQAGEPTRLAPDVASMASFVPGLAVFDKDGGGWGIGGGTSAATPLTAAIVALVLEQERKAGRPRLGSLPPLLYELARGPDYDSIFFDVTARDELARSRARPPARAPPAAPLSPATTSRPGSAR